jgi:hypothetical protein
MRKNTKKQKSKKENKNKKLQENERGCRTRDVVATPTPIHSNSQCARHTAKPVYRVVCHSKIARRESNCIAACGRLDLGLSLGSICKSSVFDSQSRVGCDADLGDVCCKYYGYEQ